MISAMPNRPMAMGAKSMPSRQLGDVEGEALGAGVDVGADQAEQQAEEHHGDRLDDRAAGQHDGGDQAERHQRAVVGRAEFLRHARQRFGEDHDDDGADGAGEERADGRDRQRRAGAAVARHLVAVETGDDRGGFARQVDQDRGRRAAVLRAVVDAGQHDQRGGRRQVEGDRQQHGDGRHRADAGQHADQGADHAAEQGVEQVLEGDGDAQAERQIVQQVHMSPPCPTARFLTPSEATPAASRLDPSPCALRQPDDAGANGSPSDFACICGPFGRFPSDRVC